MTDLKKHDINKRIVKKIENSELNESMQNLLFQIIGFEIDEGKYSNRYSEFYLKKIEEAIQKNKRRVLLWPSSWK